MRTVILVSGFLITEGISGEITAYSADSIVGIFLAAVLAASIAMDILEFAKKMLN